MKAYATIPSMAGALLLTVSLTPAAAQAASDSGSGQQGSQTVLELIVVTAQKKDQSIQEVPAAVTAVTGDTMREVGITRLADVQNLVPSIRLQTESASTEVYIRGVGSTLDLPMIESPNAYNINGIFIPRELTSASMFDVERVEVLPGPQGTLYGRGALGGSINMITTRPGDTLESKLLLEGGNYDMVRATVTQNLPVSEQFKMRVSLNAHYHEGYLESGANSAEDYAGLVSFDWTPREDLSVYVWTHIEHKGGYADNLVSKGSATDPKSQAFPHPGDPWNDRLDGPLAVFATQGPVDKQDREWDARIVGGEINWDINDSLTLTYIPSYMHFEWDQGYWITHKLGDFGEDLNQTTHELRLSHDDGGRLKWLAGFYGYRFQSQGKFFIKFGPGEFGFPGPAFWLNANDIQDHVLKGIAFFGQATYSLRDDLRIVAGGRVSIDKREAHGFMQGLVAGADHPSSQHIGLFSGVPNPIWEGDEQWDNVDWKFGVEYDAAESTMLYATVQTGYQPGTFDSIPGVVANKSKLLAFSGGFKSSLLDGRLIVNDEVFYYDYSDLLTSAWNAAAGANVLTNTDSTIYGNQLDLSYLPWENTQLRFSLGYLHGRYDDFVTGTGDFTDNQMQNAPDWTVNLGLTQDWDLPSGGFVRARVDSRFESSYWGDFSHSSGLYQDAYTKTDASLTYHAPNESWSFGLWARNLEDTDVQSAAAPGSPFFDPAPGALFLEPPRTFGVRLAIRYSP
ncbi:MAG: TonB-dependent receptor [Gammaproteobacteria bacterium]|nr:TonB-dependent receptor [Gammaproteobacteria bacterium]